MRDAMNHLGRMENGITAIARFVRKWVERKQADIADRKPPPSLSGGKRAEEALRESEAKLERHARQFAALNHMGQTVAASLDLRVVLQKVVDEVSLLVGADGVSILLLENGNELVFAAVGGTSAEKLLGRHMPATAGIAGEVVQSGQSVWVHDAAGRARIYQDIDTASGYQTQALLAVPLKLGSEIIGVMEAVHTQAEAFSSDDLPVLESAAAWAIIALKNAKLYAEIQLRLLDQILLYECSRDLALTYDPRAAIAAIAERILRRLGAAAMCYDTYDEASGTIRTDYEYWTPGATGRERQSVIGEVWALTDYPHIATALRTRAPHRMGRSDPGLAPAERDRLDRWGGQTLIVVPMVTADRVFGYFGIWDSRMERESDYDEADMHLLLALASQAAIAVEKNRLYEAEREQRALAESLRDAAAVLNSTPNVDEVLDRILAYAGRVVPHHAANIMLVKSGAAHIVRSRSSAEHGLEALMLAQHIPMDDVSYLRQMAESGQPLAIPDTQAYPGWVDLRDTHQVRSYVGAPIRPKGQVIGFLNLESTIPDFFTPVHAERLQAFADRAAVAIENARLYDAIHRRETELEQRVAERTRELAQANEQLKKLDRLKDEFLASMSHELRTPLNAILGLAEALQEQVYGPSNEKQLRSLRGIEESGRHLLSLITDILDLSKIEAGKMDFEIGLVSVEAVCQASLRFVKQEALKKQLRVSSAIDATVTTLQADERRLKQILVNLLSNATKFTPEGGAIGLEVVSDTEQQVVHFTVWDTGVGISQEDMPRLFQPFVQLDSSLSRLHPGTGLGLALVYRMTEMHGGRVSVESDVGKGSRFTVSLPWQGPFETAISAAEAEAVKSDTPALLPHPDRLTEQPLILVAEDNPATVNVLSDYLSAMRYRVVVARNGHEAIERARKERPDVILMDIQMPGMDGLEATRRLRADADLATISIIALTALAMPGDRERCLAAGVDEYLSKPVRLQGLIKAIEAQLSRNRIE